MFHRTWKAMILLSVMEGRPGPLIIPRNPQDIFLGEFVEHVFGGNMGNIFRHHVANKRKSLSIQVTKKLSTIHVVAFPSYTIHVVAFSSYNMLQPSLM